MFRELRDNSNPTDGVPVSLPKLMDLFIGGMNGLRSLLCPSLVNIDATKSAVSSRAGDWQPTLPNIQSLKIREEQSDLFLNHVIMPAVIPSVEVRSSGLTAALKWVDRATKLTLTIVFVRESTEERQALLPMLISKQWTVERLTLEFWGIDLDAGIIQQLALKKPKTRFRIRVKVHDSSNGRKIQRVLAKLRPLRNCKVATVPGQ